MRREVERAYKEILKHELMPAFGCTEPGAVAYAASKVRNVLGEFPERLDITCSGNVIKNVKSVIVPNSGGLHGIEAAAVLGIMLDNCDSGLEILSCAEEKERMRAKELIGTGFCKCFLEENEGSMYICAVAAKDDHEAEIIIKDNHTNIVYMRKDGDIIKDTRGAIGKEDVNAYKDYLNVRDIVEFADNVDYSDIKQMLDDQIKFNMAVAHEGMTNKYGADVGKTLTEVYGNDIRIRAKAFAAAASDARMAGCSLPVIVNSRSGNQGLTVSIPVIEYAKELDVSEDKLYRALLISNLIAVHIKRYIGILSAFCGAVSAGCASGAAITYLHGGTYEQICLTVINTLGNTGGIICDGAKASCAAKIASSVDAAIMAHEMAMRGRHFMRGEGIIEDIEKSIENIGIVGREGMKETDIKILELMLEGINNCECC